MWNTKRNSESCGVPSVILLVLCIMSYQTSAFVVCNRGYPVPNSISISAKFGRIGLRTPLQMSAVAETKYSSGFKNRMRNILLSEKKRPKKQIPKKINGLPSNMNIITTLEEYRDILESNRDKIIVARFFAKWCKACKSIQPSYYRLARTHSDFVFIDVPVTEKNADLHQGLGVPSLPFGHIYHPDKGLVEELKMSKKFFAGFEDALTSYAKDECNVSHRDDHMREKTSKLIDN